MSYPSSVPKYNKFRNTTPATVDTAQRRVLVTDAPAATWQFILGAISLLAEVNMWSQSSVSALTPEEIVDIFNNEVYMTEICAAVADCIQNSTTVQDELLLWLQGAPANDVVVQQVTQYMQNPNETVTTEQSTNQSLDYVYGALVSAFEVVKDGWAALAAKIQVAQSITGLLVEVRDILPKPAGVTITVLDQFLIGGPQATTAWIETVATQNNWVCGVFDAVCSRGVPYTLTAADVDAGFTAMTGAPIPLTVPFLKSATDYDTLINYWKIRSDDDSSNDWQTLCTCGTAWCHTFDFTSSDGGWVPISTSTGPRAIYYPGQGWSNGTNQVDHYSEVRIRVQSLPTTITSVKVWFTLSAAALTYIGAAVFGGTGQPGTVGPSPIQWSVNMAGDDFRIDMLINRDENRGLTITAIEMCGNGTDPF